MKAKRQLDVACEQQGGGCHVLGGGEGGGGEGGRRGGGIESLATRVSMALVQAERSASPRKKKKKQQQQQHSEELERVESQAQELARRLQARTLVASGRIHW